MRLSYQIPIGLLSVAAVAIDVQVANASPFEVNAIAQQVIVRIDGPESDSNGGSGVIVDRQGTTYFVLSAKHVFEKKGTYYAVTSDGRRYPITPDKIYEYPSLDVVEFQFTSEQKYREAELGNSDTLQIGVPVYVAGWETPGANVRSRTYGFEAGEINRLLVDTAIGGYSLGYNNRTRNGMSGGPILDDLGRLVGIHGNADINEIAGVVGSLGIPINTIIDASPNIRTRQSGIDRQQTGRENITSLMNEAISKISSEDYRGAILALNRAIRIEPNSVKALTERARARIGLAIQEPNGHVYDPQQAELAFADFSQVLRIDSTYAPTYLYRGLFYIRRGFEYNSTETRQALANFDRTIQLGSNFPAHTAFANLGKCILNRKLALSNIENLPPNISFVGDDPLVIDPTTSQSFDERLHSDYLNSCQTALKFFLKTNQAEVSKFGMPYVSRVGDVTNLIQGLELITKKVEACYKYKLVGKAWYSAKQAENEAQKVMNQVNPMFVQRGQDLVYSEERERAMQLYTEASLKVEKLQKEMKDFHDKCDSQPLNDIDLSEALGIY